MAVTVEHITFDADDAAGLARFWAAVLEPEVDPGAGREFATIGRAAPPIGGAEYGTAWTTLRDIEGNVFDIGDHPALVGWVRW